MVSAPRNPYNAIIIGDGLIGLSTALELGRAGVDCLLIGAREPGMASAAAAGLLIPSVGQLPAEVRPFFLGSLAMYPEYVAELQRFDSGLALIPGLVEVVAGGGTLHPDDAAVDNVRLLAALTAAVRSLRSVSLLTSDPVASIDVTNTSASLTTRSGSQFLAERIVLAAGAWSPTIKGLPRPLPVIPLKGQMIALGKALLQRSIMGPDCYLVPRGLETLVGATVEHAGFDLTITAEATESLRDAAVALRPELASARITRAWAGTRPGTPDMLPILGPDPQRPRLIYACGHAKNGVLLTPVTGRVIAAVVREKHTEFDLSPFAIGRFDGAISPSKQTNR